MLFAFLLVPAWIPEEAESGWLMLSSEPVTTALGKVLQRLSGQGGDKPDASTPSAVKSKL